MQDHRRQLLSREVGLPLGLVAGAVVASIAGSGIADAWLFALFALSCVLVGLAQQTLP